MNRRFLVLFVAISLITGMKVWAQDHNSAGEELNNIKYTVPFLTIAPDSRAGAMGDVGAATSPDINSQHWNPSKYAFAEHNMEVGFSYTPWLRNLIGEINLAYLSWYKKFNDRQALSASLLYFSLGNIQFTNDFGLETGQHNPNEFALDAAYSMAFSDNISGALAFRYIRSDLTGATIEDSKPGNAFAADISSYYKKEVRLKDKSGELSFGGTISNIGNRISYTDNDVKSFIPTNLRLGSALKVDLDEYNSITFALDVNKHLVPTSPIYDSTGNVIESGKDDDVPSIIGMFQSFGDAPGGLKEELHEIYYCGGIEYWYREQFAVRGGYFHEHATKGNRKYVTTGIGLKLNILSLDFSYLIPVYQNNPLANTIRFTLTFSFD
ncbi:MAG: type IX secretion system outer membrane channel protein PorV [Bacteroidales bacterium]|nr:type IX secretion system outer membrane channel protein PorV [Bacteroidales bacterium]